MRKVHLNVVISKELDKALREKAAKNKTTISRVVEEEISKGLSKIDTKSVCKFGYRYYRPSKTCLLCYENASHSMFIDCEQKYR